MTEFLGYARSRATSTTRCRSAAESWLNSGTFCSTSAADTRTAYAACVAVSIEAKRKPCSQVGALIIFPHFVPSDNSGKDVCSETRDSPQIPAGDRAVRMRQHVCHALDHARDSRRSLRQLPPVLYGQAEAA